MECNGHNQGAYMTFRRVGHMALSLFLCKLCIGRITSQTLNTDSDTLS